MRNERHWDAIVVGGGTMGTAAAWALARRGLTPLVLEQFDHVHDKGSHGGETRIIRHAYAESPEYVPLVQRADQLWQELEEESGEMILVRCGGLEVAAPGYRHARAARASADEHGLRYEWLQPADANARWPGVRVPEKWDVLFSPDSGFLLVEPGLRAMANAATRLGATIAPNTPVTAWGAESGTFWVGTPSGRFSGETLIVTAGAWADPMLKELALPLEVRRKTLWWQKLADPALFAPDRFPVFITDSPAGEIYGFPTYGTPGLKIANHLGGEPTTPDVVNRETRPGENQDCLALANMLLPGVTPQVVKSAVCLYAVTPDTDFIVDRHPGYGRIAIGAGFSGHGFKFAPAIGELLADMVTSDTLPPNRLRLSRFTERSRTVAAEA